MNFQEMEVDIFMGKLCQGSMSIASLPQQELIRPEYKNTVESQRICEEETGASSEEMDNIRAQISMEKDSGISRLTDDSDPGHRQSGPIRERRRLNSTSTQFSTPQSIKPVAKHLSVGDVTSEYDHVTLSECGAQSSPLAIQRPMDNRSGHFASENSFLCPSSTITAPPSHMTSEATLILDHQERDNKIVSGLDPDFHYRTKSIDNNSNDFNNGANYSKTGRSLKIDLFHLRREMVDMQLECDKLIKAGKMFEKRKHKQKGLLEGTELSSSNDGSNFETRIPVNNSPKRTRSIHVQYPEEQRPDQQQQGHHPQQSNPSKVDTKNLHHKISSTSQATTSSSAYNTGGDSNQSSSAPATPQQMTTTVKFDDQKICINDGSNEATIFHKQKKQGRILPDSCCSGRPNKSMNVVSSTTQSAPNVSKIRSTSVTLSEKKGILSKTFSKTKTTITAGLHSAVGNKNKATPNNDMEWTNLHNSNNGQNLHNSPFNQDANRLRPTVSASQPSVFKPDRRPPVAVLNDKQLTDGPSVDSNKANLHILADAANNLGKTILLKQRLIRQAMIRQAYQLKAHQEREWAAQAHPADLVLKQAILASPYGRFEPMVAQAPAGQHRSTVGTRNFGIQQIHALISPQNKIEWKLKKRPDGSRYISRRVIRNKILKNRAEQLNYLRTGMSSADDDVYSELKTGRYWTREERKRHRERSKERKRRQEEMFQRKMESLAQSSEQAVLRLYQRKQHKRQGHELFDNFTTIQEYLSRDTRTVNNKKSLGLLTVTTV